MSALQTAGSGSLIDPWATSHVCTLQPATRLRRSTSLRLQAKHTASASSASIISSGQNSSDAFRTSSCFQQQPCLGSTPSRRLLCRAASQPVPQARPTPSVVTSGRGLRRSNSRSRLDSSCRSTLAEPPVREVIDTVLEPDILLREDLDRDFDQEWSAIQQRSALIKELKAAEVNLQQTLDQLGAMEDRTLSEQDQQMLNDARAKHRDEQNLKAAQREQRNLRDRLQKQAASEQRAAALNISPVAPAQPEPEISVSHFTVAEPGSSGSSQAGPTVSLPEAHAPGISLFGSALQQHLALSDHPSGILSSKGMGAKRQASSAAHTTASRRSSRSSGQRSARLLQNASLKHAGESASSKPGRKKTIAAVDKSFPLPDNFGHVGSNHKLLSGDEEKRLAYQIQAILPFEEKYEELHHAKLAAAGIDIENPTDTRPNAMHPDIESGKYEPSFREWAEACGRGDDIGNFEREIWRGRQARLQMLECNQRLVRSVARHFKNRGVAPEDLIMEGMQGLRRGIDKFDPAKGFKFSTYAHWWIRQAISRSICDQGRVLKVPYHICDLIAKVKKIEREMRAEGLRPQPQQVAQKMGISINRYHEILAGDSSTHSLEQPVGSDADGKTLEETLEDNGPSMNELVVHGGLISDVNNLLHTLSPREQGVLRLRYGLDGQGERTLDDIGRFFKVTRERVRQVETKALLKLRQPVRSESLKEYTRTNTQQLSWGQCGALGRKHS